MGASPTVVRAFGPMAVESELCARLRSERDRVRADPRLLSSPLVVVTPSDGLRVHLAGLAARTVGALAGVRFVTVSRLAHDILMRAGAPAARGATAADILVNRAAKACFPGSNERFAAAAATSITDLLDAGLDADSSAAVLEALADGADRPPLRASARDAALAIVRGSIRARGSIDGAGACRVSDVLARATRALREAVDTTGARVIWIHGFTDATGIQADFLASLAAARPMTIFWDDAATALRYGAALRARFGIADRFAEASTQPITAAFRARGVEAEVREVLRRVRRLLDAGVEPERIALVARHIEPYGSALRTHAARLAIPFSGDGARGPASARGRRLEARLALLLDARTATLERWFAAHETRTTDELALKVGLRALGAGRLGDLADLDVGLALGDRVDLRLPMRVARADERDTTESETENEAELESESERAEDLEEAVPRGDADRKLSRAAIEFAANSARSFVAREVDPQAPTPASLHAARIAVLLEHLGAVRNDALTLAAHDLATDLGPDFRVNAREFHEALARRVELETAEPLGGRGGGVLVADASTARGRAFEHLFVMGLNAGVFPAAAREDPLLADEARARIAACLADLALKRARAEEERAVFAQLRAASKQLTLSWLVADADDAILAPSPLLDAAGITTPETIALALGPIERAADVAQPLVEHAQIAARDGTAAEAQHVLELALAAARRTHGLDASAARPIAAARAATVAELDRAPGPAEPLGPYFGAVGRARLGARIKRELAVTTIENVARCPWQAFLQRVLQIRPPLDPLLSAPQIDARATGSVAHALLAETAPVERVEFHEVEESTGAAPNWPSTEMLHARALVHAARILREEGRYAPGLDALVAARAIELVEAARRLDATEVGLCVLGAEIHALWPIPGDRHLGFRADRVERAAGNLRLTDWKSGRVFGDFVQAKTRRGHLVRAIQTGTQLQAFAYACVSGEGRYVALHPKFTADDRRLFTVEQGDVDANAAYDRALPALLAAWDAGAFFPRLVEHDVHKENAGCKHCELAAACVRGDTGARQRFAALSRRTDEPPPDTHEAHVRRILALHVPATAVDAENAGDTVKKPKSPAKPRKKSAEEAT